MGLVVAGTAGAVGRADEVRSLAVCRGGRIAVGHDSGAIVLRDTATGAVTATLQGHTDFVMALAVLPDRRIVSGSWDGTLRVWQ